MEDHDKLRSRIADAVRRVDEESGAPAPAEIVASWQSLVERLGMTLATNAVQKSADKTQSKTRTSKRQIMMGGLFKIQPLRWGVWYALAGAAITLVVSRHNGSFHRDVYPGRSVSTYVTRDGERANFTLPDGNTVALNVASHLEVPGDYLTGNHTVHLSGEALFTVYHHSSVPFTVVAGQTSTRVLGTRFTVRHYATDSATTVAVREGKVTVGADIVTADRLIEIRRNGMTRFRPATPSSFSFATDTLILDDLKLPLAIPELNRWYDADIRLGDPALAVQGIGGKFAAGSLADLETSLELVLDVRVVRSGRVLTLLPRR